MGCRLGSTVEKMEIPEQRVSATSAEISPEDNSKIINNLITDGEYQEAINFVMSHTNENYLIPLKVETSLSGMLNGLILNDKLKFDNFFVHLKKELLNAEEFVFVVSFQV